MYRDPDEVDETEEISLQDTQEYRVADVDDDAETEIVEGSGLDFDDEPVGEDDYEDESDFEEGEFPEDEIRRDEYAEDAFDDEGDEDLADGADPEDRGEPPARYRGTGESVTGHLKAAGSAALTQVKSIEVPRPRLPNMPKRPERKPRPEGEKAFEFGLVPVIATIVVSCLVVGVGAFFVGKGSGDDVDTARLEGAAAGKQAGAIDGAAKGFAAGFQKGRDAGFDKAYIPAYKLNYKRAFEQAGLDVPTDKEIDVPEP